MAKTPEFDLRKNPKNFIINGAMQIAQRGTSFAAIANGAYSLDRYIYYKVGAVVHTVSQDTDVPTLAESGYLFQNSLRMNLTTPDTTIASGDLAAITQKVEGYNYANLAQKPFTLSFWVKATLPGVYCVAFQNSANDRSYVAEYTINLANTWEYKTISVLASPAAGTWNYTNGIGLEINWTLAAGSGFQQTAGSWQTNAGAKYASANQVNGVNTGATDFRLTGIMLNEGLDALAFRTFGEDAANEVQACQRYYEKTYNLETPPASITTVGAHRAQTGPNGILRNYTNYHVMKRSTPTSVTFYNSSTGATGQMQLTGTGGVAISATDNSQHGLSWESAGGIAANTDCFVHWATNAEL